MAVAYLEKLNSEQRRAVEHGVRDNTCAPSVPLLVIAGAGSGKTNTLAHRVAHLVVNGAACRTDMLASTRRERWHCDGCARLGRDVSRDRRKAPSGIRGANRPRSC